MTSLTSPRSLLHLLIVIVFAMTSVVASAATERIIHNFDSLPHGDQPNGGLISDAAGNLYGVTWVGGTIGTGGVYKVSPNSHGGWTQTMIYNFGFTGSANPQDRLVFDRAGNLYGIGGSGYGTIFELTPKANGQWSERDIWNFQSKSEGSASSGLTVDAAGNLYGEGSGGAKGCGSVYRLTLGSNGKWTDTVLYSFQCSSDGSGPGGGLIFDKQGNLYGTASEGGDSYGVVFELTQSGGGWSEQVLYAFSGGSDGSAPVGSVVFDSAGNLYGATEYGGTGTACNRATCGVIFELTPSSNGRWTESVLHQFNQTDGQYPVGSLVIDQNGSLYGTTISGGTGGEGTAFEVTRGSGGVWTENVLWNFTGGKDGELPLFGVILGAAGQIYGPTRYDGGNNGNGTVFELTANASGEWKETTLTNFADGNGGPEVGLTADGAGNFYGTTNFGGAYGFGTIYELAPAGGGNWTVTILYNFTTGLVSSGRGFGASPSNLIFDGAGNLYGETGYGGTSGNGAVFELSPSSGGSWTKKDLYDFNGGTDGSSPLGGLIFDEAGNLYGTTKTGGNGTGCHRDACGTVFELSPSGVSWSKTILYNFQGGANDGATPVAGLVLDQAGNLYGTTLTGGIDGGNNCGTGCGSMFEISPSGAGWKETFVHLFSESHGDGGLPEAGLIIDHAGNLFGTTYTGGSHNLNCGLGCGTVFEFSPGAGGGLTETVIYDFPGPTSGPLAGLVMDAAGNLYGTNTGSVFELSSASGGAWNETTLHTFGGTGSGDGSDPLGSLILDGVGNLYGTTAGGGTSGGGAVFEITP